jgi:hypothetical protein
MALGGTTAKQLRFFGHKIIVPAVQLSGRRRANTAKKLA